MLKKIALAGIFAIASVVSFKPATVNAKPVVPSVGAPVMKGFTPQCNAGRC